MTFLKRLCIVVGLSAATALGLATSASATPQDVDFLDRLQKVGITTSNPYATVRYAHDVCRELDFGTPHSRVVDFVLSDNPAFNRKGAADYVVLAYMTYCPPA